MRTLLRARSRSRLVARLFGLSTFAFAVLSTLGAGEPWTM